MATAAKSLSDYDDAHRQHRDFHYCVVDAEVT
jgi:hypothetical protein